MKHVQLYTTPEVSSRMSKVKLKRGKAETILAKALWHKGFRYRLNSKKYPGSPDILISKYKLAIFVDGEFWHGFDWCKKKEKLKQNREYWIQKIEENIARDHNVNQKLTDMGWFVLRFWEKEVFMDIDSVVKSITKTIDK